MQKKCWGIVGDKINTDHNEITSKKKVNENLSAVWEKIFVSREEILTKKPGISAFISASSSNVWHKRGFAAFSQTRVNVTPQEFLLKNKKQSLSGSVEVVCGGKKMVIQAMVGSFCCRCTHAPPRALLTKH